MTGYLVDSVPFQRLLSLLGRHALPEPGVVAREVEGLQLTEAELAELAALPLYILQDIGFEADAAESSPERHVWRMGDIRIVEEDGAASRTVSRS